MVTVIGKVFDVGMLDNGRGFKLETNGEEVEVIGLTEQECRDVAMCLGEKVRITIEPDNAKGVGLAGIIGESYTTDGLCPGDESGERP